jgi:hypothetical protein
VPTPSVPPRVRRPTDRRAALAGGISDWQLRHRGIVRTSRSTYLPLGLAADRRHRIDAVLLGAPDTAVLSHGTAAALWGFEIPLVDDDVRVIPGPERRDVRRLPVTSPSRTWVDLAAVVPPPALLAATDQMLARGFPHDELPRILARSPGRRGVVVARIVASCADALAGSPMESVLRWLILEAGLPRPVLQHVLRDAQGRFLGRADLAWPEQRVIVEFDGDGHRERHIFVSDLRRQNGIVLAGWRVLRFTSADVFGRPTTLLTTIGGALGLD